MMLFSLMTSSMFALNSSSWFTLWIMMEINLLIFTQMILTSKFKSSSLSSIKYLIPQTIGSSFILMFIVFNKMVSENLININNSIFSLGIMLKMGLFPFHNWFINLMMKINPMNLLLLMTWQKMVLFFLLKFTLMNFILMISLLSIFTSSIMGFFQTIFRKIMSFSSILNSSWLTILMFSSKLLWFNFFILYSILSLMMVNMMKKMNVKNLFMILMKKGMLNMNFFLIILNMAGLPPSLGFLLKIILIKMMIMSKSMIFIIVLILTSILSLFFYSRLFLTSIFMKNSNKMSENMYKKNSQIFPLMFMLLFIPFSMLMK